MARSREYLWQKYAVEGLNPREIAAHAMISRQTVYKALREAGIEIRPEDLAGKEAPYGYRYVGGRLELVEAEQEVLDLIRRLRGRGMSLRAVCAELNRLGIGTRTRGARWHPRTLMALQKH